MSSATLPQARIPLGWAVIGGQRVAIEIDMEWMRALNALLGVINAAGSDDALVALIGTLATAPASVPEAQNATRAVDELRNEMVSRADVQYLRNRVETIEDRLG